MITIELQEHCIGYLKETDFPLLSYIIHIVTIILESRQLPA